MKKEILIVTLVVAVIGGVTFKMGLNTGRSQSCAATQTAATSTPELSANDDWQKCLDARHKEQADYIVWRGKHVQQLEACTASLGEATRALIHHSRVNP
jgi:hypothetical protein